MFAVATPAWADDDWLDLAAGAVVLEFSSEHSHQYPALGLIDGSPSIGWSSKRNAPFPHVFVIELRQRMKLEHFAIDNRRSDEPSYPGISARRFELQVSTEGPDRGYRKALEGEAKRGDRTEFALSADNEVRWLKLVVTSNWGEPNFTEIFELEAYGVPIGEKPANPPIGGVYRMNWGQFMLAAAGNQVIGCYGWMTGTLSGDSDGRTVKFEWRQKENNSSGSAIMVLSSSGTFLNGLWYQGGKLGGVWFGKREAQNVRSPCRLAGSDPITQSLDSAGRAIVYGIHFDHDKSDIKPSSEPVLRQIQRYLTSRADVRIRVEGHTDSVGGAEYNEKLSQRRAASVIEWLAGNGVKADRMIAAGKGLGEPVADNSTPQGRALNRRVEIHTLK